MGIYDDFTEIDEFMDKILRMQIWHSVMLVYKLNKRIKRMKRFNKRWLEGF